MMEQFFTREKSNSGIDIPLLLPDGTPTEFFIKVRGADSDVFRQAEAESMRRIVEVKQKHKDDEEAQRKAFEEEKTWLIAQLVIDWNLEEECTEENIIKLFTNAPQIKDEVNKVAGDRKAFFKKESANSTNSQKASTDSKKSRKARNKA